MRFQSIQALRALAAISVLITHAGFYIHERLTPNLQYWKQGASGVGLFFVISGFVIYHALIRKKGVAEFNWMDFAVNRIVRIVPLYWIATTIKLLALVAIPSQVLHAEFDANMIIKSYFFIPAYNTIDNSVSPLLGVGWTLNYEMFFYLIFCIGIIIGISPSLFSCAVFIPLAILAVIRDSTLNPAENPAIYFYADYIVLDFLFGILAAKIFHAGKLPGVFISSIFAIFGLIAVFTGMLTGLVPIPPNILNGIASFLLVVGLVSLESKGKIKVPDAAVFLGTASYSIYLFHPLLAPSVPVVMAKLGLIHPYIALIIAVCGTTVAASILYLIIEKPVLALMTKMKARKAITTET